MDKNVKDYLNIRNEQQQVDRYASPFFPQPADKDYDEGYIERYFAKRTNNENTPIIEISKQQYESHSANNSGLDSSLYNVIKLNWKISGPKNDTTTPDGLLVEKGISNSNYGILKYKEKKEMKGIIKRLPNLLQFAKPSS